MYDAMGVRRQAGMHATAINNLVTAFPSDHNFRNRGHGRGEDAAARVLEILSHRARRCSLSRSSPRGLTQCSRSSSSSSSSRCLSGLSTPKKTLSSWFFALSSGVGGGTSYVGLRLMAQRESRTCDSCAGSLARVEREGRHGQLQRAPMLLASF